jgi:primosomal protein N' (replication factor Y)
MTLVGVVDADLGLPMAIRAPRSGPFSCWRRSPAGPGARGGKSQGLIQTYQPQHPVMQGWPRASKEAFYERETDERNRAMLPPFGRLASVIVSAATRPEAETHARGLRAAAPTAPGIMVLGPAEAPLALIRGRYRFRLLVHGERGPRHAGLCPRDARPGPEGARLGAGAGGYRPAEFSVRVVGCCAMEGG